MTTAVEHYDLTDKRAVVLYATPAGDAIASAYAEAGANVAQATGTTGLLDAIDSLGGIDILACAPDRFMAKPLAEVSDTELAEVMASNFTNQYVAVRTAAPKMAEAGRIVLLTSVLGQRGLPNCSAYAAAQGAVHNLVRALAQELAPAGISVNGIALGWMDWMTDRLAPSNEEAGRAVRFTISKRAGTAEDVGALAVWLSGTGAGFVTGQIFAADGGLLQHL